MEHIGSNRKPVTPAQARLAPRFSATLCRCARPYFRRGQSAVELALITPVLALVLLAAGDAARVFYISIEAVNAAHAGVQYGAQSATTASDTAGMQQAALDDASDLPGLTATASNFCECPPSAAHVSCSSTNCSGMEMWAQVNTSVQFHTLMNYPGIPSTVTINQSALMRAK